MTKTTNAAPKEENRLVRYFRDTRAEIAKVTWPTREQGLRLSAIVLLITAVSTVVLFGIDSLFGSLIGFLIQNL
jgi:preprotein translocase subunit SecE